ncbi:hypothetical protein D9613_003371 [Agrocybe pediades]|uniref:Uncharacterized protein n=1 Tax=Agrocybe pediades TaxID=84607 RepID=A0A8H4QRL4_9AGAR|nr:hypothetical protein D9613_003371 [Agrocybe pediades]
MSAQENEDRPVGPTYAASKDIASQQSISQALEILPSSSKAAVVISRTQDLRAFEHFEPGPSRSGTQNLSQVDLQQVIAEGSNSISESSFSSPARSIPFSKFIYVRLPLMPVLPVVHWD